MNLSQLVNLILNLSQLTLTFAVSSGQKEVDLYLAGVLISF